MPQTRKSYQFVRHLNTYKMLLNRGIILQSCLLLISTSSYLCQDYSTYYDDEANPEQEDDSGPDDYSKYYSVDTSSPLASPQGNPDAGGPIEFASFFEPTLDFGASLKQNEPKDPFSAPAKETDFSANLNFPTDYFEEAQKTQQNANQDDGFHADGPDYISHHLEGDYSSDVGKVQKPKKKAKNHKYDVEKEAATEYDFEPSSPSGKYTDYNTGKSSSTVSQYPQAAGYFEGSTLSPYEKYSFRPVTEKSYQSKFLEGLISTVAPFNPTYSKLSSTSIPSFESQGTENVPSHLKGKNCRKITKSIPGGRSKREAMNCYICEDASNNAKHTQCSYAVEPKPTNEYSGISERYSTPPKNPDGFRYKRYSGDENVDPYEYIKTRSHKAHKDTEDKAAYEEYEVPNFYTGDDGLEKSFSEVQTEAIQQDPKNCRKEVNKGMTCTICKDPKSGGNFEQCSYTSEPKEQKYAYVTEKKYDSNEPEQGSESKTKEVKDDVKDEKAKAPIDVKEKLKKYRDFDDFKSLDVKQKFKDVKPAASKPKGDQSLYSRLEEFDLDTYKNLPKNVDKENFKKFNPARIHEDTYVGHDPYYDYEEDLKSKKESIEPTGSYKNGTPKKLADDDSYDHPKHFADGSENKKKIIKNIEPHYYEAEGDDADSSPHEEEADPYKDIEEYHFKLFPEFSHEESQQAAVIAENPSADTTRKDVEEVLAEFSKKNRTACKKAEKNGMTCYLCVDHKGIQNEECMYVSESKPQASHVAFRKLEHVKAPEDKKDVAESKIVTSTVAPASYEAAASEEVETKIRYKPRKKITKPLKKRKEPKSDSSEKVSSVEEPEIATPVEFEVGSEEGAYAAETKPVYSKKLGVRLPRYMLQKSEFEKEFDEFAGI